MNLGQMIKQFKVSEPVSHRGLTMFPLLSDSIEPPGYVTLTEAMNMEGVSVEETNPSGRVSEVKLKNNSTEKVLILEGEELLGAKQNRTVNLTILVAGGATIAVPVTCVEARRWAYQTDKFGVSRECHFSRARKSKQMDVTMNIRSSGSREADQSRVWQDIDVKMASMGVASPTAAMQDVFDRHSGSLQDYVEAMPPVEGQTGAVFAIGPRLMGLDLFDSASTWRKMHASLLRSYAIDAMEEAQNAAPLRLEKALAELFLGDIAFSDQTSHDAIGLGTDIRFICPSLHGAALTWDGRLIHLSSFWNNGSISHGTDTGHGISRSSLRRTLRHR
jgi:hypothetical protein